MSAHTDDLLITANPKKLEAIKNELDGMFEIRWEGLFNENWTKHLGLL